MAIALRTRPTFRYTPLEFTSVTVTVESQGFIVLEPRPPEGETQVVGRALELRGAERASAALFIPTTDRIVVVDVMQGSDWPTADDLTKWLETQPDPNLPIPPVIVR